MRRSVKRLSCAFPVVCSRGRVKAGSVSQYSPVIPAVLYTNLLYLDSGRFESKNDSGRNFKSVPGPKINVVRLRKLLGCH